MFPRQVTRKLRGLNSSSEICPVWVSKDLQRPLAAGAGQLPIDSAGDCEEIAGCCSEDSGNLHPVAMARTAELENCGVWATVVILTICRTSDQQLPRSNLRLSGSVRPPPPSPAPSMMQ